LGVRRHGTAKQGDHGHAFSGIRDVVDVPDSFLGLALQADSGALPEINLDGSFVKLAFFGIKLLGRILRRYTTAGFTILTPKENKMNDAVVR
jgi:hypothetical protein